MREEQGGDPAGFLQQPAARPRSHANRMIIQTNYSARSVLLYVSPLFFPLPSPPLLCSCLFSHPPTPAPQQLARRNMISVWRRRAGGAAVCWRSDIHGRYFPLSFLSCTEKRRERDTVLVGVGWGGELIRLPLLCSPGPSSPFRQARDSQKP